jgi:glycerol-3-phosphate dehydrogenase (NAD(P)+)
MPTTFAVLGSGAWGTTVALLLAQNPQHRVRLWCTRPESAAALRERRENVRFLPGVPLPDRLEPTDDVRAATAGADLWVSGIPTVYLRSTLERAKPPRPGTTPVLSLAKGIEIETFRRPTEILAELLGAERLAVLSGPSHAEEVSRGLPTSVVAASPDADLVQSIQQWFSTDRFRVYGNPDVLGVELAGALKNVIAIAAGICDGLGRGDNAKAALLTRGIVEMARFGVALGADKETFFGLAGIGDLITTCSSIHGRNRRVGERLAKGEKLADVLASTAMVAEGVYTAKSVFERTQATGVEMPIVSEVYRVLYEDKLPHEAVTALMVRPPTAERT